MLVEHGIFFDKFTTFTCCYKSCGNGKDSDENTSSELCANRFSG